MKHIFVGVSVLLSIFSFSASQAIARTKGSGSGEQSQAREKQMCVDMVAAKKVKGGEVEAEITKCLADPTVYK